MTNRPAEARVTPPLWVKGDYRGLSDPDAHDLSAQPCLPTLTKHGLKLLERSKVFLHALSQPTTFPTGNTFLVERPGS